MERYAELSAFMDTDDERQQIAKAFRDLAIRTTNDPQGIDAFITQQQPLMVRLLDSYIYDQDETSRDIFERLSQDCDDLARRHPEIRGLDE